MGFRSGFVSIIGRPNAGKSTLLNALVGEKVAIVTHKPQTTRNRILGIVNIKPQKGRQAAQVVLVDTPGVHKPDSRLGKKMMQEVYQALESRDLVLLIVDATQRFGEGDQFVLETVKRAGGKVFLLLNKIDLLPKERLLPMIEDYSKRLNFDAIIPLSAAKGKGLDLLLQEVVRALPEGPRYFAKDQLTDQPERFVVSEMIREKVLLQTGEEVPYATAVIVDQFQVKGKLTAIAATIFVEREGQKAIIIGKGGERLKKIGTSARLDIERMLATKVYLELYVKVKAGWRDSRHFVEDLDWRRQLENIALSDVLPREPSDEK